jgi:hypothetical protein
LLSGIRNGKEVERLQQQIDQIKSKDKRSALWYRLDKFGYCDPLVSKKTELAIRLAIDHLPGLSIHYKKITVQELI